MNKSIFILGAIALFASAAFLMASTSSPAAETSTIDSQSMAKWAEFKQTYGKSYPSVEVELYRMNIFLQNLIKIENHKGFTYELGVNSFTDMTSEEFASQYLGFATLKARSYKNSTIENGYKLSNVNWTAAGDVQPVQNQGQCGSCWAFSAVGAIESAYAVQKNIKVKLSEEQLVECSSKYGNGGCQGGLMDNAFEYVQAHALCTEDNYPYTSRFGLVGVCKIRKTKKCTTYKVTSYTDVPEGNCATLYNSLVQQPVAVAVDATNWQSYKSGVFSSSSCQAELNHGVLLTGFVATASTPFWVVRNSWGAGWGNYGYINLENGNTCGICDAASFPSV